MFVAASLGVVGLTRIVRRDLRGALRIFASALCWSAAVWGLAGQDYANIPAFVRGVFSFSAGYNEALGIETLASVTLLAATLVGGTALLTVWCVRRGRCSVPFGAIVWMALFILWKHGMVRADPSHALELFLGVPLLLPAIVWGAERPGETPTSRRTGARDFIAPATLGGLAVLSLVGASWCVGAPLRLDADRLWERWRGLARWVVEPGARVSELERALQENRRRYALPDIRARVGNASIDQYGFRQGYLLLNGLHYAPRPVPISFAAANDEMCRMNEAFYRGPKAPEFVLANLEVLDNHLVSQRDGLALAALFDDYDLAEVERGQVLLQRSSRAAAQRPPEWRPIGEYSVRAGERVSLGADPSEFVYARVDMPSRWTARIRSLLLRPPPVLVVLRFSDGKEAVVRRIALSAPGVPFLVRPLIEDDEGLVAAYRGGELPRPESMAVVPARGMAGYFGGVVRIRLYGGPAPRVREPRAESESSLPRER